jgi:hypothetical protein
MTKAKVFENNAEYMKHFRKENAKKIAFNYKNLQPLWAIDNLKKGAKHG